MGYSEPYFKIGDLVNVLTNYKETLVGTGIYMGMDPHEMYVKVLLDSSEIKEFDLTFYYLEKLN
jgi:hypothetical protein